MYQMKDFVYCFTEEKETTAIRISKVLEALKENPFVFVPCENLMSSKNFAIELKANDVDDIINTIDCTTSVVRVTARKKGELPIETLIVEIVDGVQHKVEWK